MKKIKKIVKRIEKKTYSRKIMVTDETGKRVPRVR